MAKPCRNKGITLVMLLVITAVPAFAQKPFLFSYVGGYNGNHISVKSIQAAKLTHVLYAFANVYKNQAHLDFSVSDDRNLRELNGLRKVNPDQDLDLCWRRWLEREFLRHGLHCCQP
jgi:chitinase